MDSQAAMFLAALGFFCWLLGALKARAQVWIRLMIWFAEPWLAFYFLLVMIRAEPTLVSGQVQAGYPTVACMALGVIAALSKPRPPVEADNDRDDHGGAVSA
jgi:hypothetical protein